MADPAEQDEVEDQPPKKDWRKELEDRAKQAETALVDASQELAFYKADLGHLSDAQRADVLTLAKANGQNTAEDLKAIAERLSYTKPPEQPATETPAPGEPAASTEDVARAAELAQLANLAKGSVPAQPATIDDQLAQYTDNDSLKAFLQSQIDESFGPTIS